MEMWEQVSEVLQLGQQQPQVQSIVQQEMIPAIEVIDLDKIGTTRCMAQCNSYP